MIESDDGYESNMVTVAWGEGWHHGVVGIVASKLVDRYHKPAFVFSVEDGWLWDRKERTWLQSFKCMESKSSLLQKFGGHEQAGGLTLAADSIPAFKEGVNRHAAENMTHEAMEPVLNIHCILDPEDITMENAKRLSLLEPYGQGTLCQPFWSRV